MRVLRRSSGCSLLLFALACGGEGGASDETKDAASGALDGSGDAGKEEDNPEGSSASGPDTFSGDAATQADTDAGGAALAALDAGADDDESAGDAAAPDAATQSSPVDHSDALRSVEEQCARLRSQGLSGLAYIKAVVAHMATLPDYAETGFDEASLTAFGLFRDGRAHLVVDSFRPGSKGDTPQPSPRLAAAVPAASSAHLMQAFGEDCATQAPVNDMAGWLIESGGYAARKGAANLEQLRGISGDAFFYLNTHGGKGKLKLQSGLQYSLQSSTPYTPVRDLEPEIDADFRADRLTYFTAPSCDVGNPDRTRYGITEAFIRRYWRFDPDAVVFLYACSSASTEAQPMLDAVLSGGAQVVLGYTDTVTPAAFDAPRYLVDRLIGANKFRPETPKQRAFAWDLVFEDMKNKGLTTDPGGSAQLVTKQSAASLPSVLVPSIRNLIVSEFAQQLRLVGSFGSTKGRVTVDGFELAGCTWAPDSVVCALPLTGPGSHGEVIAELPGSGGATRKSNARPLSEWQFTLHYRWPAPFGVTGFMFEGIGTLRFRGDAGSTRDAPGTTPSFPLRGLDPTDDSSLTVTASGVSEGCLRLSGSGTFKAYSARPAGAGEIMTPRTEKLVLLAMLRLDPTHGSAALQLGFGGVTNDLPFVSEVTTSNCNANGPRGKVAPVIGLLDGSENIPSPLDDGQSSPPLPVLRTSLDAQFRVGLRQYEDVSLHEALDWAEVTPVSAFELDTPR